MLDKHVYDALDKKFGTDPTVPVQAPVEIKKTPNETIIEDDFDQARTALKDMIRKGQDAVNDIMGIARQSDHPRAFEVTGQLIKTVAETAKDLLALQKQKKDLNQIPAGEAPKQIGTQNNIVFQGSTNELLKMLKQNNEKVIDADPTTSKD